MHQYLCLTKPVCRHRLDMETSGNSLAKILYLLFLSCGEKEISKWALVDGNIIEKDLFSNKWT